MAATARGIAGSDGEAAGRRQGSLNRARAESRGDAEFVAGMRAQGVMSHQLLGNQFGERGAEAARDVDLRRFPVLACVVCLQFRAFQLEVGLFGVFLRVHGHVFADRHRHRPGDQAGDSRDHYVAVCRMRRRDAQHQTGRREDPIVGAQYGRAQPADASGAVPLQMVVRQHSSVIATQ
jgi:hypothetical protein